jgi:hypothetical protein
VVTASARSLAALMYSINPMEVPNSTCTPVRRKGP